MNEPLYVSRITVENTEPLVRRATLPRGVTIEMGVHGPIVVFYHLSPAREVPLPVDYIAAATGG